MKNNFYKLIVIIFMPLYINASYLVTYKNITLGKINNFNTIKKGYLVAKTNNFFIKSILGFDTYIIYTKNHKPNISGDVKYKKDNYLLLDIINKLSTNRLKKQTFKKDNQVLTINCDGDICNYTRKKIKSNDSYKGIIKYKNNKFVSICDFQDDICIK